MCVCMRASPSRLRSSRAMRARSRAERGGRRRGPVSRNPRDRRAAWCDERVPVHPSGRDIGACAVPAGRTLHCAVTACRWDRESQRAVYLRRAPQRLNVQPSSMVPSRHPLLFFDPPTQMASRTTKHSGPAASSHGARPRTRRWRSRLRLGAHPLRRAPADTRARARARSVAAVGDRPGRAHAHAPPRLRRPESEPRLAAAPVPRVLRRSIAHAGRPRGLGPATMSHQHVTAEVAASVYVHGSTASIVGRGANPILEA